MLITIGKVIGRLVIGASVESVINAVIKAALPTGMKLGQKIMCTIGGVVVTTVISDLSMQHLDKMLGKDKIANE